MTPGQVAAVRSLLSNPFVWIAIVFSLLGALVIERQSALIDFMVYWGATERFISGGSLYREMVSFRVERTGDEFVLPYLYPPHFSLLLMVLSTLGLEQARLVWTAVMIGSYILTAGLMARFLTCGRAWTALSFDIVLLLLCLFLLVFRPVWYGLLVGQPTGLLCLLLVMVLSALQRKADLQAGILIALMGFLKITPFALMIIPLLWGNLRVLAAGMVTSVILMLFLLVLPGGAQSMLEFFSVLPHLDLSSSVPPLDISISPLSLLKQPLNGTIFAPAGFAVALFLLTVPLLTIAWSSLKGLAMEESFVPAVIGTSCLSPIVWTHHLPLAAVALMIEWFSCSRQQSYRIGRFALCLSAFLLMTWGPFWARSIAHPVSGDNLVRLLPNTGLCLILISVWIRLLRCAGEAEQGSERSSPT